MTLEVVNGVAAVFVVREVEVVVIVLVDRMVLVVVTYLVPVESLVEYTVLALPCQFPYLSPPPGAAMTAPLSVNISKVGKWN